MTRAYGQDRSNWQAVDAWTGCSFGFVKATEGLNFTDHTFARNWANLKDAKIPRGVYHFLHPGSDPVQQARFFVSVITAQGLKNGDMLVVDSEIMSGTPILNADPLIRRQAIAATAEDLAVNAVGVDAATKAFLDEVFRLTAHRVHPILTYSDISVASQLHSTAAAYPDLWLAHPSSHFPTKEECGPFPEALFWQYDVRNNTDQDVYKGDVPALHKWIAEFKPKPRPTPVTPPELVHWQTTGRRSLEAVAELDGVGEAAVLYWTFRNAGWQPRLNAYVNKSNWKAKLPKDVTIYVDKTVAPKAALGEPEDVPVPITGSGGVDLKKMGVGNAEPHGKHEKEAA